MIFCRNFFGLTFRAVISSAVVLVGAYSAFADASRTDWMQGSFGVSFHWTAKIVNDYGSKNWEQAVNNFDVDAFANSVESFGAQHVIFTVAHAWQKMPCPCTALDNVLTGRTTQRDLMKDIIDELTNRNIRVIFYYNHSCNHNEDSAWQTASGYNDITDETSMASFASKICAIVQEFSLRYGDGVSAWWFDSATSVDDSTPWPNNKSANNVAGLRFPWSDLFAAARAGNPNAAVAVNWDVHAVDQHDLATDYLSGETEKVDAYGNFFPFAPNGFQDHIWTRMDSTDWFWQGGDVSNYGSRFTAEQLAWWKMSHRAAGRMATLNLVINEAGDINSVVAGRLRDAVTIGKVWVQGRYDPTVWSAASASSNLILNVTGTVDGNRSPYSDGYHATPMSVLTDGSVPSSEIVAGGNISSIASQIFESLDGNVFTWTLAEASDIYGLNIYSRSSRSPYNGATDGGNDAIVVTKVEVLPSGASEWVDINAPALSFGKSDGISGGALAAKLVDGTGAPLATGVTAIRFTQGTPENNAALLVECEVLGCAAGEPPDPPPPVVLPTYTLTIPAKAGLVLESVKTNDVSVVGSGSDYSIVSNTTVTITFSAASGYEITSGNSVVVTVESNLTLADNLYPSIREQGGDDPDPTPVNGRACMKGWSMKRLSIASKVASETGFGWSAGDDPSSKSYSPGAQQCDSVMVFNDAQTVNVIQLFAPSANMDQMASAFKVFGSNDGSSWTELLSVTDETNWQARECRYFMFDNETAYTQYKLSVVSTVGGGSAKLGVYNYFMAVRPDSTTPWTYDPNAKAYGSSDNGKLSRGDQELSVWKDGQVLKLRSSASNETIYDLDFSAGIVDVNASPLSYKVHLQNSVKGCTYVTRIIAPPSGIVLNGGGYALENCYYLNEVDLYDAMETAGGGAFKKCCSLQFINEDHWTVVTLANETFLSCFNLCGDLVFASVLTNKAPLQGTLITSVSFPKIEYYGTGGDWMAGFGLCPLLTNIVFGANLSEVNCGQFLGKIKNPTTVYWKSGPPTFTKGESSVFGESTSWAVTNFLPREKKAEWEAYAQSSGKITLPDGNTAGTWNSSNKEYVLWWRSKAGLIIIVR